MSDPGKSEKSSVVYLLKSGAFLMPAVGQVIAVKGFDSIAQIQHGMKPFESHLQGIAIAGTAAQVKQVKNTFHSSSAIYFPRPGALQTPPLDWQL